MVYPDYSDVLDVRRRDLNRVYRPQREWIEGRGLLLVVAHFFSGVGAGAWLFSLLFGFRGGLWLGLICVAVLSGAAHLVFLGRWTRFWRILRRPHSSWISRGMWGIALFSIGAVGPLLPGLRETTAGLLLTGLSLVGAAIVLLYEGFVFAASRAIPFWHTRLLPVLYVAYGLRGGAALLLVVAALGAGVSNLDMLEAIKLWVVVSSAVLVLLYVVTAGRAGGASRHAARQLVAGQVSASFYGGAVLIGIVVPLGLALARELEATGQLVVGLIGVASLVGDFYVKYCVSKAGTYVPLGNR